MTNDSLQQLRQLVKLAKAGSMPIKDFCEAFERIYNLELDKSSVSPTELKLLLGILDKVVWFSPYPDERKQIPNYLGEDDIRRLLDEVSEI